jgi:hypothetical protein
MSDDRNGPKSGAAEGGDEEKKAAAEKAQLEAREQAAEVQKRVETRRFSFRMKGFLARNGAIVAIVAIVLVLAYAAILRSAWVTGARGTADANGNANGAATGQQLPDQSGPRANGSNGSGSANTAGGTQSGSSH